MFATVLVANRGEIAVRIISTLRRLGIRSAAVYSDADVGARHVLDADVARRIGPAPAAQSYLDIEAVVSAALEVGADAVHPGYGFLAENAAFARACVKAGLIFVGPPADAIEAMGDKIRAKQTVEAAGVPVVPGLHRAGLTDEDLTTAAGNIGFPVLLKPSAGGGGKGMRRVEDPRELGEALASARREARTSFGDDSLLIERFVDRPRHIEVQVLADSHGEIVHLGERECSLQRRHQKVVEEAPSVLLSAGSRAAIGASAVQTARSCGYVGAGTVEFIVSADRPAEFFFMEMNTRLQVEHPVTELVTGVDLVEQQLRVAAGEKLPWAQDEVVTTGHAVEARVYAEDPHRAFLPTGGTVLALHEPQDIDVRVDSGLLVGTEVGSAYDPMLAKVIAWGADRSAALAKLDAALADTVILGVETNTAFLRALIADPAVQSGELDTGLIERRLAELTVPPDPAAAVRAAVLLELLLRDAERASDDPFVTLTDWRLGGSRPVDHQVTLRSGERHVVSVEGAPGGCRVSVDGGPTVVASANVAGEELLVETAVGVERWAWARDPMTIWVGRDGATWQIRDAPAHTVKRPDVLATAGPVSAPMPGTVAAVHVEVGEQVTEGQPVVSVEAMKMEHVVRAVGPGVVGSISVSVGDQVSLDQVLATIGADEGQGDG